MHARFGIGYDTHRLVSGRKLMLGGVEIESERGLEGHSDADVLTHAVIDALLGAAGLGDIGQHFPDTDAAWKDADSIELLRQSCQAISAAGFKPVNIDTTISCEAPKLAPYRDQMRERLATAADLPVGSVNVKFTTGETIGFVGRGEGLAALAIAAIVPAGES